MIRIAITPAAFDAIAATLQLGNVGFENAINERVNDTFGCRPMWSIGSRRSGDPARATAT